MGAEALPATSTPAPEGEGEGEGEGEEGRPAALLVRGEASAPVDGQYALEAMK